MLDLRSAPVTRLLLPFSAGAYLGFGPPGIITAASGIPICLVLWALTIVFFRLSKDGPRLSSLCFATICFLLFLSAGYGFAKAAWKGDPQVPRAKKVLVQGILRESPVSRGENLVFDLKARMVHDGDRVRKINTILKVYLPAGVDSLMPVAGETRIFYGSPYPIRNSGNPGDPDFETILHRQNCWYRFYADPLPVAATGPLTDAPVVPMPFSSRIRKQITDHWTGSPQERGLLQAVCLGEQSGLTDDLRQSYSHAGGMHLLAVSGLHVGLIWWVLRYLLSFMMVLPGGVYFRAFSVVFLLWSYALVTGFAPPVCRSVLMFSLITISRFLDHRTHPVNAILVSAFLLLVADPGWITRVGFQLSYAAILGIALLHRPLKSRIRPGNRLFAWIWQATVLSFSAQLATAPLVIYYFHQFPVYSLVTSLAAIPLLSCLIALFVFSVPFVTMGILPGFLNRCMMELAGWMNRVMEYVSSIPGAVAGDLHIDRAGCLFFMILVGLIISAITRWRGSLLTRFFLVIALVLIDNAGKTCRLIHSSEMVAAHFNGGSLVTFREGIRADHYLYAADSVTFVRMNEYLCRTWERDQLRNHLFILHDTISAEGSVTCSRMLAPGIRIIGNDHLSGLVVSGTGSPVHDAVAGEWIPDFILLCNGAGAGGTGIMEIPAGTCLIIDGSNIRRWVAPQYIAAGNAHLTGDRGAFILRW